MMIRSLVSFRTLSTLAAVLVTVLCADVASAQEAMGGRSLIDLTAPFSVGLVVIVPPSASANSPPRRMRAWLASLKCRAASRRR